MSRSRLRPAAAPHSNKPPGACPHCGSCAISRKGVRKKKLEIVQLGQCGSCKRIFMPSPAALRNKTYPIGRGAARQGATLRHEPVVRVSWRGGEADAAITIPAFADDISALYQEKIRYCNVLRIKPGFSHNQTHNQDAVSSFRFSYSRRTISKIAAPPPMMPEV